LKLRTDIYRDFAARLEEAMAAKSIRRSSTALANLFNSVFDGKAVTIPTVSHWMHGWTMPTQDKLLVLAKLLDTSAEHLRFGQNSEKHSLCKMQMAVKLS
jgi:hypothetical protein